MSNKALLIGNGTFREDSGLPNLNGPEHDIAAMREALTHPEYGLFKAADIVSCDEFDQVQLGQKIQKFFQSTSREDFVLFYYSGHGLRLGPQLYLATKNTVQGDWVSAMPASNIMQLLELCKAERVLFVLDCCYADAAFGDKGNAADLLAKNFPGWWTLSSSPSTQTSKDGNKGEPSQFTSALIRALVDPALGPDDELGRLYLNTVHNHIIKTLRPLPVLTMKSQEQAPIAQRVPVGGARGALAFPELDMLSEQDLEIVHDVTVPKQQTVMMRHLSALLDLVGQPRSVHHQDTVDTVRSYLGTSLRQHGVTDEILDRLDQSLVADRLTRLSLRISEPSVAELPWEYTVLGERWRGIRAGFLALRKNLIIERRVPPDNQMLPPEDGVGVSRVALIGSPVDKVPAAVEEALTQDLAKLEISVKLSESGRGMSYEEITNLIGWPAVLVVLAAVRRITRVTVGGKVYEVEIQFAGPGGDNWIDAQMLYDVLQDLRMSRSREGRAPFRAIIVETFAARPGDDAQGATAELAARLAGLGLGNVVFLCHPPGFNGYKTSVDANPIRTFAGHLIGALNAKTTVPRAFHVAWSRMQVTFVGQCEQDFGIPGLYIPEYAQPQTRRPSDSPDTTASRQHRRQQFSEQQPRSGDGVEQPPQPSALSPPPVSKQLPADTGDKQLPADTGEQPSTNTVEYQ